MKKWKLNNIKLSVKMIKVMKNIYQKKMNLKKLPMQNQVSEGNLAVL